MSSRVVLGQAESNLFRVVLIVQDTFVDIRRILPPLKDVSQAARIDMAELPLIPIDVEADRQYLVSLRHGIFVDRAKLFQLLEGQQIEPADVSS